MDLRPHFSRFLSADPDRLHFAAHSHHPWPDVTRDAQLEAWDGAARLVDDKWEHILGPVLDELRGHVARHLGLPDPATLAVAPNTHDFVRRLLSCFPAGRPVRILTTDGEFHSFARQAARLAEEGVVTLSTVAVEPVATFPERFATAARAGFDHVYVSQVFFNSGFAIADPGALAAACGDAMVAIDGYHGFLARPTDLSDIAGRCFYLAGGYKYAMAGEGVCFMHCPPGWGARPRDTGWYAAFGALSGAQGGRVDYARDGWRFMGATFDPSGLFRMRAVLRWLDALGLTADAIHAQARRLQDRFLAGLPAAGLDRNALVIDPATTPAGNFLTFERADAAALHAALRAANIVTDVRGTRLRLGFGLYHTEEEVDRLLARMRGLAGNG